MSWHTYVDNYRYVDNDAVMTTADCSKTLVKKREKRDLDENKIMMPILRLTTSETH